MKYLKSFNESVSSYKWDQINNKDYQNGTHFGYLFLDEFSNKFKVEIEKDSPSSNKVSVRYFVGEYNDWGYKLVKTNIYRVVETVIGKILSDFINKNSWCESIKITGLSKDFEKDSISQRTKFYYRYLRNNPIDGWKLSSNGNDIFLDKISINENVRYYMYFKDYVSKDDFLQLCKSKIDEYNVRYKPNKLELQNIEDEFEKIEDFFIDLEEDKYDIDWNFVACRRPYFNILIKSKLDSSKLSVLNEYDKKINNLIRRINGYYEEVSDYICIHSFLSSKFIFYPLKDF